MRSYANASLVLNGLSDVRQRIIALVLSGFFCPVCHARHPARRYSGARWMLILVIKHGSAVMLLFASRAMLAPAMPATRAERCINSGRVITHENGKTGARNGTTLWNLAEREGFEPPEACASTVFKTAVFDHSTISPFADAIITKIYRFSKGMTKKMPGSYQSAFFLIKLA